MHFLSKIQVEVFVQEVSTNDDVPHPGKFSNVLKLPKGLDENIIMALADYFSSGKTQVLQLFSFC